MVMHSISGEEAVLPNGLQPVVCSTAAPNLCYP